jgi:hypothetical protein
MVNLDEERKSRMKAKTLKVVISSALFLCLIFSFSFISASDETLLRGTQYSCVDLVQSCDDCTEVTLASIRYPDGILHHVGEVMTKDDTDYNYTFCDTEQIGAYTYNTCGDLYHTATGNRVNTCENIPIIITSDGLSMTMNIHMLLLAIVFGLIVLGISINDVNITALGNFGLYYISIYFIRFGLAGYTNWVIEGVGICLLATAFYTTYKVWEGYSDGM